MPRVSPYAQWASVRSLRHWRAVADGLGHGSVAAPKTLIRHARELRGTLDRVLSAGDVPDPLVPSVAGATWMWRPEAMRLPLANPGVLGASGETRMGEGLKLFYEDPSAEVTLRQRPLGTAFDLALDVYRFDGAFLSFILDLPAEGIAQMGRDAVVVLSGHVRVERALEAYVRLNVVAGPNTRNAVLRLDLSADEPFQAAFALAHMDLGGAPVTGAWVDLILEAPRMNGVVLSGLTIARRTGPQF